MSQRECGCFFAQRFDETIVNASFDSPAGTGRNRSARHCSNMGAQPRLAMCLSKFAVVEHDDRRTFPPIP